MSAKEVVNSSTTSKSNTTNSTKNIKKYILKELLLHHRDNPLSNRTLSKKYDMKSRCKPSNLKK